MRNPERGEEMGVEYTGPPGMETRVSTTINRRDQVRISELMTPDEVADELAKHIDSLDKASTLAAIEPVGKHFRSADIQTVENESFPNDEPTHLAYFIPLQTTSAIETALASAGFRRIAEDEEKGFSLEHTDGTTISFLYTSEREQEDVPDNTEADE